MKRVVDTREYLDMVRGLLSEGRKLVPTPVAGSSMTPFLHHGDTAYLDLPDTPLKKGDIVLYTRPDGRYVLHRIIRVNRDGSFTMLGDAQTDLERIESAEQIHARVSRATHKGKPLTPKSLRWRFFATVWVWLWPLRPVMVRAATALKGKK